jgi:sugar phosphate isomerase/epimerase
MHAKDGLPPNRGEALGQETPLGEGKVPFSILIPRLCELGFGGPVTIEREISGPKQREDIVRAMKLLAPLAA